ncbi:uncharacterized protein SPSK_06497 [Sporothrix schenckii 1099-18]|uniref:RTA1 like protein n=2 Tax=Sporothrix schenckii TaxID=29908 RepID=U7PUH9_SPOS1|nr:uncharacterized protein SPSK_06497 [Sporothrix schenckii 1099-18]ERS98135.1 hypothetical protein HMPREF1624_04915 [Sporothrix schenckii ATCC 58251]KJR89771.1 hypothetical protein SPSK_06497 [Sporothrix schenckii 1099-18]
MASNSTDGVHNFVLYNYNPSKAAAFLFLILFGIATIAHVFLMVRHRTWYFVPFVIGLIFEAVGYVGRALSAGETPNWTTGPYILQSLTLLLGPTLLAASIYMTLGRLVRFLQAEQYSPIRTTWLTKIFVTGDVLSFLTQGGGGGIIAQAKTADKVSLGENVILGGLILQILFFGVFMAVTVVVHRRIAGFATRRPTFFYVLYGVSVMIMVRSIFRVAEYAGGSDGALQKSEVYIYVFDATLMLVVAILFGVYHPSKVMDPRSVERNKSTPLYGSSSYPLRDRTESMAA